MIAFYDPVGNGLFLYKMLIDDICKMDRSWMSYEEGILLPITDFSARVQVPPIINKVRERTGAPIHGAPIHVDPSRAISHVPHSQLQEKIRVASDEWAAKFRNLQAATGRDAFHGVCLRFEKSTSGRINVGDFPKVRRPRQR